MIDPKNTKEAIRVLCSYHDSEIMRHMEAIKYHQQLKALILGVAEKAGEEVSSEGTDVVNPMFVGPHKISEFHTCFIRNIHQHGSNPDKFYRPTKSTHYKVEGKCRVVTGENGEYVDCSQHES